MIISIGQAIPTIGYDSKGNELIMVDGTVYTRDFHDKVWGGIIIALLLGVFATIIFKSLAFPRVRFYAMSIGWAILSAIITGFGIAKIPALPSNDTVVLMLFFGVYIPTFLLPFIVFSVRKKIYSKEAQPKHSIRYSLKNKNNKIPTESESNFRIKNQKSPPAKANVFSFNCSICNQSLEAPFDMSGQVVQCPACNKPIMALRLEPNAGDSTQA